jgi:hypothetical protein
MVDLVLRLSVGGLSRFEEEVVLCNMEAWRITKLLRCCAFLKQCLPVGQNAGY